MAQLAGKRAIITGAASGIGRASAVLFAREGACVTLVDIDEGRGRAIVEQIAGHGGRAMFLTGDVTRAGDCQRAVAETVKHWGGVDILFNNAGIIVRKSVTDLEEAEWERVMAVNVKSVYLMSKHAAGALRASGGGSIINTASGWGLVGGPQAAAYCASKGAVVLLTKAMAIDFGRDHIRVNCLCPGDIETPMLRHEARQLGQEQRRRLRLRGCVPATPRRTRGCVPEPRTGRRARPPRRRAPRGTPRRGEQASSGAGSGSRGGS